MEGGAPAFIESRYEKLCLLKKSDKGEIHLAIDPTGTTVVIKRLRRASDIYALLKKRPHPLWPRLLHVATNAEGTLIVEEYIGGCTWQDMLENGQSLTEPEAKSALLQMAEGLGFLHGLGVIHRDIKPANIVWQNGRTVRLLDFDAARFLKQGGRDTEILGTRGYAPPEQFGYSQTDERSDIYALGVTLREMLPPDYRGYLQKILAKCAELDPNRRYRSMDELHTAVLQGERWQNLKPYLTPAAIVGACLTAAHFLWLPTTTPTVNDAVPGVNAPSTEEHTAVSAENPNSPATPPPDTATTSKPSTVIAATAPTEAPAAVPATTAEPYATVRSGQIKTSFAVNGQPVSRQTIFTIDDWQNWLPPTVPVKDEIPPPPKIFFDDNWNAELLVENDGNTTWETPALEVYVKDNHGAAHHTTQTLAPLAPGESAGFYLPLANYSFTGESGTTVWLQAYLQTDGLPSDEKYWCVTFEVP